jgi:hypothetical protein
MCVCKNLCAFTFTFALFCPHFTIRVVRIVGAKIRATRRGLCVKEGLVGLVGLVGLSGYVLLVMLVGIALLVRLLLSVWYGEFGVSSVTSDLEATHEGREIRGLSETYHRNNE